MKCSSTTSKKASFLVFKTAFGFTVRCLDSSQFQHIDLGHITAAHFCRWYSVIHIPSNNNKIVIQSLTPNSSYKVYLRNRKDPFDVKSETVYFYTSGSSGESSKDFICSDSWCFSGSRDDKDHRCDHLGVLLVTLVSRPVSLLQEMGSDISQISREVVGRLRW